MSLGRCTRLVSNGDHAGVARLLNAMPRSLEVHDPGLALDLAVAWFNTPRRDEVEKWCRRAEQLGQDEASVALRVHTVRCLLALMAGNLADAAEHIAKHADLAERSSTVDPLDRLMDTLRPRVMLGFGDIAKRADG